MTQPQQHSEKVLDSAASHSDKTLNPERSLSQLSQHEIHHLITVSTGVIDLFVIEAQFDAPILLPQNIVISVFDTATGQSRLNWKGQDLPVWAVHTPAHDHALALVIEGDSPAQRFILLCDQMPKAMRWRISEVVDEDATMSNALVFKYVVRAAQRYIVPNMQKIETVLGITASTDQA